MATVSPFPKGQLQH